MGSALRLYQTITQLIEILECFQIGHQGDDTFCFLLRPLGKGCTVVKFVSDLRVGERVGRRSFAEVGTAGECRTVFKMDRDNRRHLIVTGSLGLGVPSEIDPLPQTS